MLCTRLRERPCNAFTLRVSASRTTETRLSFTLAFDVARQVPTQLALRAFDGDSAIVADVHLHLVGNLDRLCFQFVT